MTDTPLLAVGQVATAEGLIHQEDTLGRVAEVFWCAANDYRRSQPLAAVTLEHDDGDVIGSVLAYERSKRWGLLCAMTIRSEDEGLLRDGPWYLSPTLRSVGFVDPLRRERGQVLSLSVVRRPGNVQTRPLHFGSLDTALAPRLPLGWDTFWGRAKEQATRSRYRAAPECIEVVDLDELDLFDLARTDPAAARRQVTMMRAQHQRLAPPARAEPEPGPFEDRVYRHHHGGRLVHAD